VVGAAAANREKKKEARVRPILWAAAYVLISTFSFAPTLSFVDAPAAPGTVAAHDVVAPRDLIVADPDATARRRAEAADEVLPIYDHDALASARFEEQLRSSFERARAVAAKTRPRATITPELRDAFPLPLGGEALGASPNRDSRRSWRTASSRSA
jgi:membrane-associated HD superfamily phosphohydrolase